MLLTDLQNVLSPNVIAGLADDDGDGLPDTDVLNAAWVASEREVRARLDSAPGDLTGVLHDITITLTVERLYERRREVPPNVWQERAQRARTLLSEMAKGNHPGPRVLANMEYADRITRRDVLELN